uniref:Uncharacterized protein n=1 Tax=Anguilla anguilla TaxID=7936 RepID=A0A0E9T2P7_ANGAN
MHKVPVTMLRRMIMQNMLIIKRQKAILGMESTSIHSASHMV